MTRKRRVEITVEIYNTVSRMIINDFFRLSDICQATGLGKRAASNIIKVIQPGTEFITASQKKTQKAAARNALFSQEEQIIYNRITCNNSATQAELVTKVEENTGTKYHRSTIGRKLVKLGMSKKRFFSYRKKFNLSYEC